MCSVIFFTGLLLWGLTAWGFSTSYWLRPGGICGENCMFWMRPSVGFFSAQMKQLQLFAEKAEIQLMFFYSRSNGCEKFRQPALTGHLDRYEMYINYVLWQTSEKFPKAKRFGQLLWLPLFWGLTGAANQGTALNFLRVFSPMTDVAEQMEVGSCTAWKSRVDIFFWASWAVFSRWQFWDWSFGVGFGGGRIWFNMFKVILL